MRVPRWLVRNAIRRPRATLLLWLISMGLSGIGVSLLKIDTSTDSVLDRSDPTAWPFYQRSLRTFGGDEVVVVAIGATEPYDARTLALVAELTEQIRAVPGIRRVDSLSTVPLIRVALDGAVSLDPALNGERLDQMPSRVELADQIGRDRIARRTLVSDDGRLFAINALLDDDVGGRFETIVQTIRALAPRDALISGVPVFRTAINTKTASEVVLFVVLTILVISLLLYVVFNSLLAVAIPLFAAAAGTLALLAAMGFAGEPLSLTTMVLPSIMLAIGCANVMHVITQSVGAAGAAQLERALDPVILPALLSGLTTTIGFLAISGVRIEAVQATGTYGAVGVLVVLAATLTAVPAALVLWPLPTTAMRLSTWLRDRVCPLFCWIALNRRRTVLALWAIVALVSATGAAQLHLETDATTWFPRRSEIRSSYEQIRERLSGISPMNVVIQSQTGEPVTKPEVLAAIAALSRFLESLPEVGRAISVVDPLMQLHGGLIARDAELPDSREAIEQYLLLLESVDQMRDLVSADRASANVVLRVDNNGSDDLQNVAKQAEQWWRVHGVPGYSATATGVMFEFARAEDMIAAGQVRGIVFALLAIGVVLLSYFRELRLTFATIAANATPILLAFGTMGFLQVPLDAGTVVVGNLAIGIAIDETLHLASGLRTLDAAEGSREGLLLEALQLCVPSIVYTTTAIALGFGLLGLSSFSFTRDLGLLTAGVMILCLAADVLLLPALLLRRDSAALSPAPSSPR